MGSPIERLPHRAPFLFVSEVLSADAGAAHCAWNVGGTEEFLKGHFPGRPLVPGRPRTDPTAQRSTPYKFGSDGLRVRVRQLA
jgi:3-hydroxymyristoyl/3-hydroxydecanoyl-(acyl carrier protein) dehydratase